MHRHEFTVIGNTHFPMDMLRYDACFPRDGESVHGIEMDPWADQGNRKIREVRLVHYDKSPNWEPTAGRWGSFLWSVKNPEMWK